MIGLDDQTLVGAPAEMLVGSLGDLRRPDAIILDERGFRFFCSPANRCRSAGPFEMNDHRAEIVGICKSFAEFSDFSDRLYARIAGPIFRRRRNGGSLSFVLAKAKPGVPREEVCDRIQEQTGLMALSQDGFAWRTITLLHEAHRHPGEFRHHRAARLHHRRGHRRADVLPVHARQSQAIRRLKAMGVSKWAHRRHGAGARVGGRPLGYMIGLGMGTALGEIMGI